MPNIITHTIFADELLDSLQDTDWLQARKHLMEIGSNGPDILFFHGLSPRRGFQPSEINQVGSKLHKGHVNAFYRSALDSIRREKNPEIRLDLEAYVIGHLCHWALDSTVHPYVFYKTGTCTRRSAWDHHRMESLIDAIMLKVKRNETIWDFDTTKITDASLEEARAVAKIYVPAIEQIFDEKIKPRMIKETLEDWHFMQGVFRDPHGTKGRTLRRIEKISGMQNLLSGYLVPEEPIDNYDVMNLLHKEWSHPCGIWTSTESIFDLYDRAMEKAKTAVRLFLQAVDDPHAEQELLDFVDDSTYNLGINKPLTMTEFDLQHFI